MEKLREEWLSPELMSALRAENLQLAARMGGNLRSDLTENRRVVVRQTQAQIVGYLRGWSFNSRRLAEFSCQRGQRSSLLEPMPSAAENGLRQIVNYIRQSESDFKEWHSSETAQRFVYDKETAKLFAPPVFRNDKKASGYFF